MLFSANWPISLADGIIKGLAFTSRDLAYWIEKFLARSIHFMPMLTCNVKDKLCQSSYIRICRRFTKIILINFYGLCCENMCRSSSITFKGPHSPGVY